MLESFDTSIAPNGEAVHSRHYMDGSDILPQQVLRTMPPIPNPLPKPPLTPLFFSNFDTTITNSDIDLFLLKDELKPML